MADAIEKEVTEPQVPDVENEDFGFEIVDDDAPQVDEEKLALQAKLKEQEEQISQLSTSPPPTDNSAALIEALRSLKAPSAPAVPEVAAKPDLNKLAEQVNADYFKNPANSTYTLVAPLIQELQGQMTASNSAKDVQISQLLAMQNDSSKDIIGKYGAEVTALVEGDVAKDAGIYQRAVDQVRIKHFDDIMAEKLSAKMEELEKQILDKARVASPPPFTQANLPPATTAAPVDGRPKVKRSQEAEIKRFAFVKGVTESAAVEYYSTKGWLK